MFSAQSKKARCDQVSNTCIYVNYKLETHTSTEEMEIHLNFTIQIVRVIILFTRKDKTFRVHALKRDGSEVFRYTGTNDNSFISVQWP